jgi:hypothetical protein
MKYRKKKASNFQNACIRPWRGNPQDAWITIDSYAEYELGNSGSGSRSSGYPRILRWPPLG